jgi:hypothetical protein
MPETSIWPVEEMVHEDEFTDRVELLRELDQWVKAIGRMGSWSTALIAPRRIGKTVLLDRLVNTVFFKPEYQVAPFYFKMTREKRTLKEFILEYATTFFRQYLAYCEQDADLFNKDIELEELLDYKTTHKFERFLSHLVEYKIYFFRALFGQPVARAQTLIWLVGETASVLAQMGCLKPQRR